VPILLVRNLHSRLVIEAGSIAVETPVRLRQRPSLCRYPTARCTRLSTSKRQQLIPNMAPNADFRLHRLVSPSFLSLDDDTEQELRNADLLPNPQAYPDAYRATLALSVAVGKTGLEPQLIDVVNMMRSLSALERPVHT
jgi:hypothetical protein